MSAPRYYTHTKPGGAQPAQRPNSNSSYQQQPVINGNSQRPISSSSSQAPLGHQRPLSAGSSQRPLSGASSQQGLSARDVDLNLSQLSVGSGASASTMRLGGIDYAVGSRIGSSGLFIIGQPEGPHHHHKSQSGLSASQPSMSHSQGPLIHKRMAYVSKGYSFEYWNWGLIRFSLFIVVIAIMIGLLATTIGLSIRQNEQCDTKFAWWEGPAVYHIPVGLFYDSDSDTFGDLTGLRFGLSYVKSLGVEVVVLSHMLPASIPSWHLTTSYHGVDPRLGTQDQIRSLVKDMGDEGMHILLELNLKYTSVRHQWFLESERSSINAGAKFENFYTWKFEPDPAEKAGNWHYSTIRNQYYLHDNDTMKPIVNWTNPLVYEEMGKDLQYWLQMGVHGFILSDFSTIGVDSDMTAYNMLNHWRDVLDGYSSEEHKVLVLNGKYLTKLQKRNEPIYNMAFDLVDLVHVPLTFNPENRTRGLVGAVNSGLDWQREKGNPWVLWTLQDLSRVDARYVDAMETFMMTIPGTPCITAGQEIGQYLLEEKSPDPLLWSKGNTPYLPGSTLGETNIRALEGIIKERNVQYALRRDNLDPAAKVKEFNYQYLDLDDEAMLMERVYGRSDAFFFLGNFGRDPVERDWSDFSPSGGVVANTQEDGEEDRVGLKRVELQPGQGLVLRIKK